MAKSSPVQSLGWTTRNAAVSVLLVMEEHRKQAGQRLAALRDSQGLNQEDLAHLAGLSVKTISRFENGRHDGRRATVRALAKALKVNEQDIIGPPPAPLGMGETQLDRIEQKLDDIITLLGARSDETLADVVRDLLAQLDAQHTADGAGSPRTAATRKAS